MKRIRKQLTYANVMSSIAMFLVIAGGTAFAFQLGKNSVGTRQLKRNAVTSTKIRNGTVTGADIRNQSLRTQDLGRGAVTTPKLGDGVVTTPKLGDGAVTTPKLGDGAVTNSKIAASAVTSGKTDGSIQKSGDLLFATVAPATAAATIVRGRGATSVTRIGTGFYAVTFNRDITGCSWLATYGPPDNAGVGALWATVRGRPSGSELGVVLRNDAGAQADGNGFHVAVLCP